MKKTGFLLIFMMTCLSATAQINFDSLWAIWQDETVEDTVRLDALHEYSWEKYLYSQPDSTLHFAEIQYQQAKLSGSQKRVARSLNTSGTAALFMGDYSRAFSDYQRALHISVGIKDEIGSSNILVNMGLIYSEQGDYVHALENYEKALEIKEKNNDKVGIGNALSNIAIIYHTQKEYKKALVHLERSLTLFKEVDDKSGVSSSLNNIGETHMAMGDHDKALTYFQRSIEIANEVNDVYMAAVARANIGQIYHQQGKYEKALEYFERSHSELEALGDLKFASAILISSGEVYTEQKEFDKAIDYCERALNTAKSAGIFVEQSGACDCLYEAYKAKGDMSNALTYYERINALKDSAKSEETAKRLQLMEFAKIVKADSIKRVQEDLEAKNKRNAEIKKSNFTRNVLIGAGILLLVLAIGFYIRWRYVKKSRDTIAEEKDRSENILLNILPEDIAEELKSEGKAKARNFDTVSIIFTDFKDFTSLSSELDAEELMKEVNYCFEAFDSIMEKYNIEKIKTIGDAYMAAGGLPIESESSVKETVLAALEMQAFVSQRFQEKKGRGEIGFEMRCGIHTGPVVAGIVGVKKFQYDVWGDTVNTASRIESSGEAGKVNISETTYALLKDDPDLVFESRGKIETKGKGMVEMYFVSQA